MQEPNNEHSKDRRQLRRESVRQPATLQSPEHGEVQVLVRNFSATSMYLGTYDGRTLADDENAGKIQQGDDVFVRIELPGKPPASLAASVDRVGELGLGVTFYKPQPQLDEDLKNVADQQGFMVGDDSPVKETTRNKLLQEYRDIAMDFVKRQARQLIKAASNDLFDAAGKVGENSGQAPYFDAMAILRKQGKAIQQNFIGGVQKHLSDFGQVELFAGLDANKSSNDELSLVDESEFEVWLALSEIMNTAESRNHRELHMLEARMGVLLDTRVDSRNNPVSPAALCHHLYESVKDREFEHGPLQAIWGSFNKSTGNTLTTLYQQLNQLLIDGGILPKLSFRFGPGKSSTGSAAAATEPVTGDPNEEAIPTDAGLEEAVAPIMASPGPGGPSGATIIDLSRILKARQTPGASGGAQARPGSRSAKPFGMEELNEALLHLQSSGEPQQQPLGTRITDALKERHGGKERRQLGENHAQAVFLAQELLHAINNDEVLEPQAKQWVQRLEVPLLRLLLHDDSILQDSQHPARKLINELGQAQAGISDPMTDRDRQTIDKIEAIVDGLGQVETPDNQVFDEAAQEIQIVLKRQQRLRAIQMKRVLEACDGQQKLDTAKATVEGELERRFAGEAVPRVIVDLLNLGLRNLLDLAVVRTGLEGDEYRESISLVDELRNNLSAERPVRPDDKKNSAALLERIDEKLIRASVDNAKRQELGQELSRLLPGLDSGQGPKTAELIHFPSAPVDRPVAGDEEDGEKEIDHDHALWLGRAKLMQVGSWMLYPTAEGPAKPLKLAWVSDDHDRYVFVDRQGHKSLEITPTELAEQLKGNKVDILDQQPDQPLMDRSWEGMIQHMHEQIAHQATHDQLTDVLNRKEFERQLRLKLGESKLMQSSHVALQIDIDQFRVINSTTGHDAGDQLLRDIAKIITEHLPEQGVTARLGGDEFAVLLPRCELAPGHEIAETLRQKINKHRTGWKRRQLKSTASIGLVSLDRDCESVSQTLNQLESACAAANDAGGDRVKSYQVDDEEMTRRDRAINWVKALESGLDAGRVELHAQRIISLDQGNNKEHYEVLARLRDVDGNAISPEDFVPAAEAYGRIHLLDEWVFRSAFEALASSPHTDQIERLSLNVSGKTFSRPRFVQYIKELLEETGIHASKICFEITETAAISNLSRCTDFLRQLRKIGCRFSLDDFGTGLSSFSYLKNLPVDYLKIDGSFVKEIVNSSADYGLVKTINEVGHFLGKKTVAEYVENEEILKRVKEIGLDYAQGFGISKPKPLNEVLKINP